MGLQPRRRDERPPFPQPSVQFVKRESGMACTRCGSLVEAQDQQVHRNWHRDNDK